VRSASSLDHAETPTTPLAPLIERKRRHQARLPLFLTSFVGRERESAEARALLRRDDVRLVVLTGPGGVGKTRLAVRVAADLADAFADGVAFVALAPVADPALAPTTIAQALGLREATGRPVFEALAAFLVPRELLLVLDNLEHLLVVAPAVVDLLAACPRLTVLATSRAVLHVSGEHDYPVPPLPLPPADPGLPPARLADYAAVALFAERARAAQAGFALSEANAAAVAEVCRRLDGLPLAIELAAARVAVFPLAALLARLGQRLPLLGAGPRDQPARLQTMRAAIAWSHDLLSPEERALFRRLVVFVGGFSLESVEAVASRTGEQARSRGEETANSSTPRLLDPSTSVLDGIASLLDKSLVRKDEESGGEPRFSLLEVVREYALERLEASGEEAATRDAHAAHFLRLVRDARVRFEGSERNAARDHVAREHGNLRAALGWAVARGDAQTAQALASELARFWVVLGYITEARDWLDRVVAMEGTSSPATRVQALYWAAGFAVAQNGLDRATALATEALALAQASGYRLGVGMSLQQLGAIAEWRGNGKQAEALEEEALALFRALDEPVWEGVTLRHLGVAASERGDHARATVRHQEALAIWRRLDHPWGVPAALRDLADEALLQHDVAGALPLYKESLAQWQRLREKFHVEPCFWGLARVALATDQTRQAVRLLGAVDGLHEAMRFVPPADVQSEYARAADAARTLLGEAAFAEAWAAGRALPLDAAIAEALALGIEPAPAALRAVSQPAPAAPYCLTERERAVLTLIAEGHSDRQIAEALFISRRTVTTHVTSILTKLGVDSRTAAATHAVRLGLV
jgi:predicted ATPase/DNA-binding CsgD family transcriptional regulator